MRHPTLDALLTTSVPTRRTVIGGLLGLVALGVVSTVGCEDEGVSAALAGITDDSDTGSDVILAHEAAVSDDDATYFVDFTTGSIMRRDAGADTSETLYTNGRVNQLGIDNLVCADGIIYFGDVPSSSICSISTEGGDVTTLWTSEDVSLSPVPIEIAGDTLYFSVVDDESLRSTIWSISLDGSDAQTYTTLPDSFSAQYIDPDSSLVYYSGISSESTREIHSATLAGKEELTVWAFDDVTSSDSAITWQVTSERVVIEAQDNITPSNQLLSVALDGTDEQVLHDFSSQKVMFDLGGTDLYFVDRETFAFLVISAENLDETESLASIPKTDDSTAVSSIAAGDGKAWVTTVTAGEDTANIYTTYEIDRETGKVTELA